MHPATSSQHASLIGGFWMNAWKSRCTFGSYINSEGRSATFTSITLTYLTCIYRHFCFSHSYVLRMTINPITSPTDVNSHLPNCFKSYQSHIVP